ncbi:MAG: GNAT family N-acetyltransferase [Verrucomicrobiales bacterium]
MKELIEFAIIAHRSPVYEEACQLRDEMLRKPLGLSLFDEDLDIEADYVHVIGRDHSGALQAYLQLKPIDAKVLKMQQVAVVAHLQGQGIGRALVEFAEAHARSAGYTEMILHARGEVAGFYEMLGYRKEGESFLEVTIPHFKQRKLL